MRILALADAPPDLPAALAEFVDERGIEAVVTAGDLLSTDLRQVARLALPKLGVYGNHCNGRYFEELGFENLHLRSVDIAGLRFTGLQGCVRYKPGSTDILYTQDEYRQLVAYLEPADVIITHCPPRGINDHNDPAHQGVEALRSWIDDHQPRVLIHGHTYPDEPVTRHGPTRVEYVQGARVLDI